MCTRTFPTFISKFPVKIIFNKHFGKGTIRGNDESNDVAICCNALHQLSHVIFFF
jgi:hypothetical protein